MCSDKQPCEGMCGRKINEYYPGFMSGLGEDDTGRFSMWNIPASLLDLDFDVQCAAGRGLASQLLDMYDINGHTAMSDNDLPAIIEAMGVKLDGVKIGFLSELASCLVIYAKQRNGRT